MKLLLVVMLASLSGCASGLTVHESDCQTYHDSKRRYNIYVCKRKSMERIGTYGRDR